MGCVKFTGTIQLTPAEDERLRRDLYRGLSIKKFLILQVPKETCLVSAVFANAIYMD